MIDLKLLDITGRQGAINISSYYDIINELDENWNLILNHDYLVFILLKDERKNLIYLTENIIFDFNIHLAYTYSGSNTKYSCFNFKATQLGKSKLTASFTINRIIPDYMEHVKAIRDYTVWSQVKIVYRKSEIILPYLGFEITSKSKPLSQEFLLHATGGSDLYTWQTENNSVAYVTVHGLVSGNEIGDTFITLFDKKNNYNNATIKVIVIPIETIEWFEERQEIEIHKDSIISLIAKDKYGRLFSNCTSTNFQFATKEEDRLIINEYRFSYFEISNFVSENLNLILLREKLINNRKFSGTNEDILYNNYGICLITPIIVKGEGILHAQAKIAGKQQKFYKISSFTQILGSYNPTTLKPSYESYLSIAKSNPDDEKFLRFASKLNVNTDFVLGHGSGMKWEINSGNEEFSNPYEKINETIIITSNIMDSNLYYFKDSSKQLSSIKRYYLECMNEIQISSYHNVSFIYNYLPSSKLLRPLSKRLSINVYCETPKKVSLIWIQPSKEKPQQIILPNPISSLEIPEYILPFKYQLNFITFTFDMNDRLIWNASGYMINYKTNNTVDSKINIDPNAKNIDEPFEFARIFNIESQSETAILLESFLYFNSDKKNILTDKLIVKVINKIAIFPQKVMLYNDIDNSFELTIKFGSGDFSVTTNCSGIISISHLTHERKIQIKPLNQGFVQIKVEDLSLQSNFDTATIIISDLHKINLYDSQVIEQYMNVEVNIKTYGIANMEFDSNQIMYMAISLSTDPKGTLICDNIPEKYDKFQIF